MLNEIKVQLNTCLDNASYGIAKIQYGGLLYMECKLNDELLLEGRYIHKLLQET